jgi:HSP20 family molecular chaperone IbpA
MKTNTAIEKKESTVNVPERIDEGVFYTPLVDIIETNDEFVFQADLPGVKSGDLNISFDNGVLTIDGKVPGRPAEGRSYLWSEYGVGHFYRSFTLNTQVNVDQIRAELKNGELTLHVPKAESAKTRRIPIKAS